MPGGKNKRKTKCPGCHIAHPQHSFVSPGPHCSGRAGNTSGASNVKDENTDATSACVAGARRGKGKGIRAKREKLTRSSKGVGGGVATSPPPPARCSCAQARA